VGGPSSAATRESHVNRTDSSTRTRTTRLGVAALALASAGPLLAATPAGATTVAHYSYTGSAYGTTASVGSVVKSGPSAPITFGCTTNPGLHPRNTTAGLNLAPLGTTGTVASTGDTSAAPVQAKTSASTASVNLLSGLVHATAIKAASSTTATATGYALSSAGTSVTSLVVAGVPVKADAAPNTRITLTGFGYLIVNEQIAKTNGLTVNGLHLFVTTTNRLGVAVGSNLTISHADSALTGPVAGVLGGYAYGTKADLGTLALSGPSFTAYMPCQGTGGVLRSNTGAGVNLGTTLTAGTITDTDKGAISATSANGETTSTVQAANVLNGLVKATLVKADAHAASNGSTYTFTDTGSGYGSLTVTGHPEIGPSVAANTTVALPGIGTLYLRRVLRSSHSITIRMIELVLTNPVNGLSAGTDIKVAVANATAS